jgi:hypothetical protein
VICTNGVTHDDDPLWPAARSGFVAVIEPPPGSTSVGIGTMLQFIDSVLVNKL